MTDFRADLHCHTTCSDGTVDPEEIVKLAIINGLSGLSITDHDTIDAYGKAVPIAKEKELPLISGVEFSALHRDMSIHILAYSFSLDSPLIKDFCSQHHLRRVQRNRSIIERLAAHGLSLDEQTIEDLLTSHRTIGRPHIALALLQKGYVSSLQEAFQLYLGDNKPCYVPGQNFSVEETIDLIHKAKGFAIIAHPHLIENSALLHDVLNMQFDGIEAYYGRLSSQQHERWLNIGKQKGWLITGGSDFHGDIKPNISLGSSWVGEEIFKVLQEQFHKNSTTLL